MPEVAGRKVAPAVAAAARGLVLGEPDALVIASPHGPRTGVYTRGGGDLDAFGPRGIGAAAATSELGGALAAAWERPALDAPWDHGIVVALRLLGARDVPVVAVAFEEGLDAAAALADAEALADALPRVARTVAFVASANTSAGLDGRAPLPSLPGAAAADAAVLEALGTDPRELPAHLPALATAGSCAAGPLAALSFLLGPRPCDVLVYEHPCGVGYPVALSR